MPVVEQEDRVVADQGFEEGQRIVGRGVDVAVDHGDPDMADAVPFDQFGRQGILEPTLDQEGLAPVHAAAGQQLAGELDRRGELAAAPELVVLVVGFRRQSSKLSKPNWRTPGVPVCTSASCMQAMDEP